MKAVLIIIAVVLVGIIGFFVTINVQRASAMSNSSKHALNELSRNRAVAAADPHFDLRSARFAEKVLESLVVPDASLKAQIGVLHDAIADEATALEAQERDDKKLEKIHERMEQAKRSIAEWTP